MQFEARARHPRIAFAILLGALVGNALLLGGCGDKAVSTVAVKIKLTILCSALGKKPSDPLPQEIVNLYSPIRIENTDYYPVITIQRIDLDPLPSPLSWSVEPGLGRAVERTLGTWNLTKEQRALRSQVSTKEIGKSYSDAADGNKRPWEEAVAATLPKFRQRKVFALQAGRDAKSADLLTVGTISLPTLPSAAAFRDAVKATFSESVPAKLPEYAVLFLGSDSTSASPPGEDDKGQDPAAHATVRIHGSNTIGSELMPLLVEEFLKHQNGANLKRIPTNDPLQTIIEASLPGSTQPEIVEVSAHGSATAFEDLPREQCDVGMSSRRITPEEAAACATAGFGNMYSQACEHILGLDGIAVIVNRANPVRELTKDQLAGIFSGNIRDWREVGGAPGFIVVYARDDKSGTFDTFKALVLAGPTLVHTAHRIANTKELSARVASDPMGVGFVGRPFIGDNKALPISDKGTIPFVPNRFTIATEDYPLSRRLYLYTPRDPPNPLVRKFIDFALADNDGQEIVVRSGFIAAGQKPKVEAARPPENAPPEYLKETQNASRVDLNFRFRTGSSELDNKALRDLDRVAGLLKGQEFAGRYLLLFGFADSTGTASQNLALSKDRARAVARQLGQRGVVATVITGFGQELPIASNDTAEGKEKNRRVEVWLRVH